MKTRGSFHTPLMHVDTHCRAMDDAATNLIYLAIRSFEKAGLCVREWSLVDAGIAGL